MALALHGAAQRRKEALQTGATRLARGARMPAYVDHPKQFLQQNVFRAHQLVPTYAVYQWDSAQSPTFGAIVAVPWLVDESCTCENSRRARAAQQDPSLVRHGDPSTPQLWSEILGTPALTQSGGSGAAATCFCRVAFGYGLAPIRKEAERMAAADVACKLHAAGLLDNLYLEGQAKMAEHADLEPLPNELGWYTSDPKSAIVNFSVQKSLNLCFSFEDKQSKDPSSSACEVTATMTLSDGTQLLTRGTGRSRKMAEKAASLLLCEHPDVCSHLKQPHRVKRKKKNSGYREASLPFTGGNFHSAGTSMATTPWSPVSSQASATVESDDEDVHVVDPAPDPEAVRVAVVVPDKNCASGASPLPSPSADVFDNADRNPQATRDKGHTTQHSAVGLYRGAASTIAPACTVSTEWFAHNPKLYLLRYSQQYSLDLDWDREETGPAHGRAFHTTVRVPLPGMLADPLYETAQGRTKREAENAAALAACRTLCAANLLHDPQEAKPGRAPGCKRLKSVVPSRTNQPSKIGSIGVVTGAPGGMRVRLPGEGPLTMRTPHMKGLIECNQAHVLPEPVPLVLPNSLDEALAALEGLVSPDMPRRPRVSTVDSAFVEYFHGDPTLSPTIVSSQWPAEQSDLPLGGLSAERARLSVFASKGEIILSIHTSQVVLVTGPSGSGKSSQLCQYIMDDWEAAGHGSKCSVVQCLPNSLVAESTAHYVAAERSTEIGTCVGYHTQQSHTIPPLGVHGARVVFTTNSTLLQRLEYDPFLADVTHVIVDVVDSRTLQVDFILTYIRTLLPRRNSLRLILIAQDDDEACKQCMQEYFSEPACVNVAGPSSGDVPAYFLEDVLRMTQPGGGDPGNLDMLVGALDEDSSVDLSLVTAVIAHIVTTTVDGGILVFLPAADMVSALCTTLSMTAPYSDASRFCIVPVDAMGTLDSLRRVYQPVDLGVRKIVIATSLAERELPVEDIGYVIDSGRTQERTFDTQTGMTFFGLTIATRAECQRRRAKAAGASDGCYFCLLSTSRAAALDLSKEPEMKRMPLEEAILPIQLLELGSIQQFLSLTPDPPPASAIGDAVRRLHEISALSRETDELTPMGRQLAQIPFVHPRIGKLLVFGALFDVREDALTIAAGLCVRPILVLPREEDRARAATAHLALSGESCSDHQSVLNGYSQWARVRRENGQQAATEFASAHFLSDANLHALDSIRPVLADALTGTGIGSLPGTAAAVGEESRGGGTHMGPLLRAAITSSLMSTVLRGTTRSGGRADFCTHDNCRMMLHPSSVNAHKTLGDLHAPWLVFSNPVPHQSQILARVSTVASIAAIVALSHGDSWERVDTPAGTEIVVRDWVRFICPVVGTIDRVRAVRDHLGAALALALHRPEGAPASDYEERVFAAALPFLRQDLGPHGDPLAGGVDAGGAGGAGGGPA